MSGALELGEGVLVLGVQEQPGEQRRLVLGPEDRHEDRGLTTHNWNISPGYGEKQGQNVATLTAPPVL